MESSSQRNRADRRSAGILAGHADKVNRARIGMDRGARLAYLRP
ncbi:MAG: hypothetical protein ACXIUV_10800 [Alkalilacustris sp.]